MNINKRKYSDGRVRWRARYPDPTRGGKKQIERQFATKREAERWWTAQRSAVQRGEHIDPKDNERLVKHVAEAWRATWLDLEPKTIAGYEAILRRHVLPRWGEVKLSGLTPEAIQAWINGLSEKRKPNTVRRVYSALRGVLKVAVERRYLMVNPCDSVRLPKPNPNAEPRIFLTAAEVQQLSEAIDPHYCVLVYTAAYTGLRAGELGGLRKQDVDALHGRLTVERALKDVSGRLIFGGTKTGEVRRVGLPKFLSEMLAEHLERSDGGPDSLVFTGHGGGPLRHHNFYLRHFKPAVRAALPEAKHALRFHDLRHTCASLLIAAGAHPKAIQEHLGHRDIQTTFNVYGHLLPSAQEALKAKLDSTYEGANARPENVTELRRAQPE